MSTRKSPSDSSSNAAPPDAENVNAGKSSARSTVSGPTQGVSAVSDAATAKLAGGDEVASAFPFNAAKPSEFGDAARNPVAGQAVEAPHPLVFGSTLTEINA